MKTFSFFEWIHCNGVSSKTQISLFGYHPRNSITWVLSITLYLKFVKNIYFNKDHIGIDFEVLKTEKYN